MKYVIKEAVKSDLSKILELQHLAFQKEAAQFNDYTIDPVQQTLEELEREFQTVVVLVALNDNGKIIGSTRGHVENDTSYIGRTFVHPDYRRQGVATSLIHELENLNPASRYEINSSIRCPQNIRLYEHLGFTQFKEIKTQNNGFVYLEKTFK